MFFFVLFCFFYFFIFFENKQTNVGNQSGHNMFFKRGPHTKIQNKSNQKNKNQKKKKLDSPNFKLSAVDVMQLQRYHYTKAQEQPGSEDFFRKIANAYNDYANIYKIHPSFVCAFFLCSFCFLFFVCFFFPFVLRKKNGKEKSQKKR